MAQIFILLLIVYAATGLILSLAVHLLSYTGIQFGGDALFFGLHVGIFPLWLPVVLIAQEMTKNSPRKDFWKIAMSGCPVWMKHMASGFFGYAIVNFLLFMFTPTGSHGGGTFPPAVLRGFSGHWMAFYSAGLAVMTTAYRRGISSFERYCKNGHEISYDAKFCSVCGVSTDEEDEKIR